MSMTPLDHEAIEALIAANALGGLEDAGRQELARLRAEHGPNCAECRRLEMEYAEVAGLLATSLDPVALSAAAEDRLMAAVRQTPQEPAPEERPGPAKVRQMPGRTRRWIATAAVAAALAVLAGVIGYSVAPSGNRPGTQTVAFPITDGQLITVVYQPGETQGWLVASGLPAPEAGQVYELWYILPDNPNPQAAGTFVPTNGSVVAPVTVGESFAALAISVEPEGGSTTEQGPRGPVILQATV
jgi:anti-sigma-K factor RskA